MPPSLIVARSEQCGLYYQAESLLSLNLMQSFILQTESVVRDTVELLSELFVMHQENSLFHTRERNYISRMCPMTLTITADRQDEIIS